MILSPTNITSPDQNSRLFSIGFDGSLADEHFQQSYLLTENSLFTNNEKYAFSLTRLLELLPDYINIGEIEYKLQITKSDIKYVSSDSIIAIDIKRRMNIGYINNAYIEMCIETFEELFDKKLWKIEDIK